jgi:hypothetical protein
MGCAVSSTNQQAVARRQPTSAEKRPKTVLSSAPRDRAELKKPVPAADRPKKVAVCGGAAAKKKDSKHKLAGPNVKGALSEFWEDCAWSIITPDGGFYVYSDCADFQLKLIFTIDAKMQKGSDDVIVSKGSDGNVYTVTLWPGQTKLLWRGGSAEEYESYGFAAESEDLPAEYEAMISAAEKAVLTAQLDAIKPHIKRNGNDVDVEATLAACIAAGVRFVDPHFAPHDSSLGSADFKNYSWKRLEGAKLVGGAIAPGDIDQGNLGDCWFLSAMAALAEDTEKVKDIFRHPTTEEDMLREHAAGAFRVTINKHGWWHHLVLDDLIPHTCSGFAFAGNAQDPTELWVALLEKAYARVHGNYNSIVSGDPVEGLADLTGYPYRNIADPKKGGDKLFHELVEYDKKGYMITMSTAGTDESDYMGGEKGGGGKKGKSINKKLEDAGLTPGHAFSVLQAKHFPEEKLMLLQIRNPWGNATEWNGAWGDKSPLWDKHPKVRAACNFTAEEDGSFWMQWTDALQYFDGVGVCFVERNWFDYRVEGKFDKAVPNLMLEVTVSKPTEMYIILSQKDERGKPEGSVATAGVLISVCEPTKGGKQYTATRCSSGDGVESCGEYTFSAARDVSVKVRLEPSAKPYLIVPSIDGDHVAPHDFVLGVISSVQMGQGVEARFVTPPAKWGYFEWEVEFDYTPGKFPAATARFQFNPETGCPITHVGKSFSEHPPVANVTAVKPGGQAGAANKTAAAQPAAKPAPPPAAANPPVAVAPADAKSKASEKDDAGKANNKQQQKQKQEQQKKKKQQEEAEEEYEDEEYEEGEEYEEEEEEEEEKPQPKNKAKNKARK